MKKLILMLMLFAPMTMFAQQAKFGHCDTQQIMTAMPEFIKARGEVEIVQKQKEDELKAMQDEFQRKVEEYQKTQSTMNETKRKETEESLAQMQQKLQQNAYTREQAEQVQAGLQKQGADAVGSCFTNISHVITNQTFFIQYNSHPEGCQSRAIFRGPPAMGSALRRQSLPAAAEHCRNNSHILSISRRGRNANFFS